MAKKTKKVSKKIKKITSKRRVTVKRNSPRESIRNNSVQNKVKNNFPSFIMGIIVFTIFVVGGINKMIKTNKINLDQKKAKNEQKLNQGTKYSVAEGDDLCKIAEKFLGSCSRGHELGEYNKLQNPDTLEVGQVILIPPTPGETSSAKTNKARADKFYIVQEGDSLNSIALKQYGDENMWIKIVEANKLVSPDFLSKGAKLIIPR